MRFRVISESVLRKSILLSIVIAVPIFAWGQKPNSKEAAPKPAAPQQHASPPKQSPASHSAAPGAQHGSAPGGQRGSTPGAGGPNARGPAGTARGPSNGANAKGPAGRGPNNGSNAKGPAAGANARGGPAGKGPAGANAKGPAGKGPAGTNAKGPAGKGPAGANARGPHTPPGKQVALKGGGSAHIRPNGQVRSIDRNGMHIEHGVHGGRRIVSTRNGARVVTVGKRGGYVQRPYFARGGRTYVQRTYVVNNVSYTGVYRSYGYGGYCCYYGYYPPYYYHPAYYGWAYNPWPAPVAYGWGWGGAPWYGYYGAYYEPYPVYPSAAFWLTDFVIAASLQAAYEAQANAMPYPNAADGTLVASLLPMAAASGSETAKLSPEVKKALADEVKAQLAAQQAEAGKTGSSGGQQAADSKAAPPALDPAFRTFVVSSDLTLVADGDECDLSEGDVITRTTETPDDDKNVNVKVAASKKSDCAVGKEGPVSLDDLQEMHNHFLSQLTSGMGELAKKQGTGGLPKAPDTSTVAGDVPPPPADKTAQKALQEQQSAADQTESEVKQEAASDSGGGQ